MLSRIVSCESNITVCSSKIKSVFRVEGRLYFLSLLAGSPSSVPARTYFVRLVIADACLSIQYEKVARLDKNSLITKRVAVESYTIILGIFS